MSSVCVDTRVGERVELKVRRVCQCVGEYSECVCQSFVQSHLLAFIAIPLGQYLFNRFIDDWRQVDSIGTSMELLYVYYGVASTALAGVSMTR